MRIFVSSTSEDLAEYRLAAIQGLRRLGHEVVAMEDFTATTAYPLNRVLELVKGCDALVMLVAWRYGYVPTYPEQSNPPTAAVIAPPLIDENSLPLGSTFGRTSITEYEFLAAKEKGIDILAFILAEGVAWPPHYIDGFAGKGSSESILRLRAKLMNEYIVSFFSTSAEVESMVTAAIANTRISNQVDANLVELGAPVQGGQVLPDSSYTGELVQVATTAQGMKVVTIDIATEWWSTRLYLLAYLLQSVTDATRILILHGADFVGLLSVEAIVKTLVTNHAELQRFNRNIKRRTAVESDVTNETNKIVSIFEKEFVSTGEYSVKLDVSEANLQRWFGEAMITSPIRIDNLSASSALDLMRLLDYPSNFVPVVSGEGLVKNEDPPGVVPRTTINVIDTLALSHKLARIYVTELLDTLLRR